MKFLVGSATALAVAVGSYFGATSLGGDSLCPSGFKNTSTSDEHTVVYSCLREDPFAHVILTPDKKFERADLGTGEWITDPSEVDGWVE